MNKFDETAVLCCSVNKEEHKWKRISHGLTRTMNDDSLNQGKCARSHSKGKSSRFHSCPWHLAMPNKAQFSKQCFVSTVARNIRLLAYLDEYAWCAVQTGVCDVYGICDLSCQTGARRAASVDTATLSVNHYFLTA